MANLKNIKNKIKAISNIKKITKTMEMVSFAKMKKANAENADTLPYINEVKSLIERLVEQNVNEKNPLFSPTSPNLSSGRRGVEQDEVVIIFASNKGLCGSYNSNIYKKAKKYIEENQNIKKAICLGKFADRIAKRLGLEILQSYVEIDKMQTVDFTRIEKNFRNDFLNKNFQKIHVVYTNFVKNGVYEAVANCIYPLSKDISKYITPSGLSGHLPKGKDVISTISQKTHDSSASLGEAPRSGEGVFRENAQYIYEPGINNILNNLVPKLVSTVLYSYLLESRASEHSMRSFAMKRANEAAGEIVADLKLTYNKVRQDSITQEIAEISAGANAS